MEPESLVRDLVKGFIRCASKHNASIASQQLVLCDRAGSEFYFEEDTLQEALGEDIHLPLLVQELSPCPSTAEECIKNPNISKAERDRRFEAFKQKKIASGKWRGSTESRSRHADLGDIDSDSDGI